MDVDRALATLCSAEPASPELETFVYEHLKSLAVEQMRGERSAHTLQPTALVHEAWLRIAALPTANSDPETARRFYAIAASTMRRVLIDHARRRGADKRGGGWHRITVDEDLGAHRGEDLDASALEAALSRLQAKDPRAARIVELRAFAGLPMEDVALVLGVSRRTAQSDWALAKAFLRRELELSDRGADR